MKSVKCHACGFVGWAVAQCCKKCGASLEQSATERSYQMQSAASSNGELKKGLAICSLVVGIVDLFTLGLLGIGALVGVALGIVALGKIKRHPLQYGGKALATAGLVTSILSVAIVVPVGIVAAIAIPNLLAARRAANEGSALSTLRSIYTAEASYQEVHEKYGTLEELAEAHLLNPAIATGGRNGYRYEVHISAPEYPDSAGFEVIGVPVTYPSTGRRSFFVDETGVIRAADAQGRDATRFDSALDSYPDDFPERGKRDNAGATD